LTTLIKYAIIRYDATKETNMKMGIGAGKWGYGLCMYVWTEGRRLKVKFDMGKGIYGPDQEHCPYV